MATLQKFRTATPRSLQEALLRCAIEGCQAATGLASRYSAERHVDAIPALRRLEVERLLEAIAVPPGFQAQIRRNSSTTYVEISGPGVIVTGLTRTHDVQRVDVTMYRKFLAEAAQQSLFQERRPDASICYGILLYGGPWSNWIPSVLVKFPTEDGQFLPSALDLVEEFPDVVASYTPEEEAEPVVERRVVKKKQSRDSQ